MTIEYKLSVDLDRGDMAQIMWALRKTGGKVVDQEGKELRRTTARMARDAIWPHAPHRAEERRSRGSKKYGPLSRKNKWPVTGDLKRWGVKGPYYLNFVRAGTAGWNRAKAGPRDFIAPALARITPKISKTLRDGVAAILQRHFTDDRSV